ncbi:50S ribosomal protein L25 [Paenibacillus sp. 1001270B_150601_E10]|uniref:50S ribosomal protein L25 n=1 Tax=Paenibacillus sp. 1001270B_150601_E10 TaxID=2787079 RepID=UPI00189CA2B7|nr:50S ribosomal protein L25 [Paenibacillus sp. 1001270B_150601_E10]
MSNKHQLFQLTAERRSADHKSTLHQLREEGRIPAIVYGAVAENIPVHVQARDLKKLLQRGGAEMFELTVESDKPVHAVLKEIQAIDGEPKHADFFVVRDNQPIRANIPLEFEGTPKGAEKGGITQHVVTEIEVEALPALLPHSIPVDLSSLEIGDKLHAADVKLPEGLTLIAQPDTLLASIVAPQGSSEAEEKEAVEEAE